MVLGGALALAAVLLYLLTYSEAPPTEPQPQRLPGLAWLPAEAGLVAGVDLVGLRQQTWLVELVGRATHQVQQEAEYQAFIEASGFDYARDLDSLWLGVFGPGEQPLITGVAEGRFARAKILNYARQQGAAANMHRGIEIYRVRTQAPVSDRPERIFAFAFLDDTRLAFGSDREQVATVIDCWLGKTPAVGSDASRRAELERLAAGQQAWAVDELAKWELPIFGEQGFLQGLRTAVVQVASGIRVSEQGLAVWAAAQCRDPGQAQRLRDNLNIMLGLARLVLLRQADEGAQGLGKALERLELSQHGDTLEARATLAPETLAQLLGISARSRP